MTLIAIIYLGLLVGRGILFLTEVAVPVIWNVYTAFNLAGWVLGGLLAFEILGWLPTITFG